HAVCGRWPRGLGGADEPTRTHSDVRERGEDGANNAIRGQMPQTETDGERRGHRAVCIKRVGKRPVTSVPKWIQFWERIGPPGRPSPTKRIFGSRHLRPCDSAPARRCRCLSPPTFLPFRRG